MNFYHLIVNREELKLQYEIMISKFCIVFSHKSISIKIHLELKHTLMWFYNQNTVVILIGTWQRSTIVFATYFPAITMYNKVFIGIVPYL